MKESNQEKCKLIHQACGWKPSKGKLVNYMWAPGHISEVEADFERNGDFSVGFLSYDTSLDAMHEAEKVLSHDEMCQYVKLICDLQFSTNQEGEWSTYDVVNVAHAEAHVKAQAFGIVLKLWHL